MPLSLSEIESVLTEYGWHRDQETKAKILFLHPTRDECIYLDRGRQGRRLVIDPRHDDVREELASIEGVIADKGHWHHSSNMRRFPKRRNKGKTKIAYGIAFSFESVLSLQLFLSRLLALQSKTFSDIDGAQVDLKAPPLPSKTAITSRIDQVPLQRGIQQDVSPPIRLSENESFSRFAPYIAALPSRDLLTKDDLLVSTFLLHEENGLAIYYAPFDYVHEDAKIVLVGITPGWTQMEIGYRFAREGLQQGMSPGEVCAYAKRQASFAGSMRKNLINMLDGLELPKYLGIASSSHLFGERRDLLHTTSSICYPVFVEGKNYTGHKPKLLKTPVLRRYLKEVLATELRIIKGALIIPLGKSVSAALRMLIDEGLLDSRRCLLEFPHPSGANGHRAKQYASMQADLKRTVEAWFK